MSTISVPQTLAGPSMPENHDDHDDDCGERKRNHDVPERPSLGRSDNARGLFQFGRDLENVCL